MLPRRLNLSQTQDTWAQALDPIISNPLINGTLLKNVALVSGTNVINHKLSRSLVGWIPTRVRTSATFYDAQDQNQTPQLTLVLIASADSNIDLWVF